MSLYDECIMTLGKSASSLEDKEGEAVFNDFQEEWLITSWGRIDWSKVNNKQRIDSAINIKKYLSDMFPSGKLTDSPVYILWDEASLAVVESRIDNILEAIDDVTAVSFDTWIYCPSLHYVIEFYHEGEIFVGIKE